MPSATRSTCRRSSCGPRPANGRSPAAPAPAASPGSTSRISPGASVRASAPATEPGAAAAARRRRAARRQIIGRVERLDAVAHLEMELRPGDGAGGADARDRLAAPHLLAALYQQHGVVRIGGHPAVGVLDQDEVAITAQLVAGIGDDA